MWEGGQCFSWQLVCIALVIGNHCYVSSWSILHLAIIFPMRWLAAKTREMAEYKWGYIELNGTLDRLKDSIEAVVEENGRSVSRRVK